MAKKSDSKLLKRAILGGILSSGLLGGLIALLFTASVVALPAVAAGFAWDRIINLFDDHDWKNAVETVKSYQIPTDRDNLLLYRPIYMDCKPQDGDCKPIAEDSYVHWLNYGTMNDSIYRVPTGRHSYTFDIGREALVSEIFLVMACKKCDMVAYTSFGNGITGEFVARAYSPDGSLAKSDANNPRRLAAINNQGGAMNGVRFITLVVNNEDNDCYFAQVLAFPPDKRSNALWAGQPVFDTQYRNLYGDKVSQSLGKPGSLDQHLINSGSAATPPDFSFYYPAVDSNANSYLPVYPVVGQPARAGDGSPQDVVSSYQPVYLSWKLHDYTDGKADGYNKLDEVKINWLQSYGSSPPPAGPTPTPGSGPTPTPGVTLPRPAYAKHWKVYLFSSTADAALLSGIFGSGGNVPATLPADKLLKEFSYDSPAPISTGKLSLAPTEQRDTLVFVFDQSSFLAPTGPVTLPGQLSGLPLDWLSLAEVSAYELPPKKPKKPKQAPNWTASGGGAYDIRYGSITAEKIEAIIATYPWTGIAPGGYPAGESPSPNKLTGMGQFFIQMGEKYGINPAYALAFAIKETSLGTTGYHVWNADKGWGYNLYGMTGTGWVTGLCNTGYNGRFCGYSRFEASIEDFFGLLSEGYGQGQIAVAKQDGSGQGQKACPCTTVDRILPWYAPYFENDTDLYITQMKALIDEWGAGSGSSGPVPAILQYDPAQYDPDFPANVWRDSTCGPTSATMIINSFGYQFRVVDLLRVAGPRGDVDANAGTVSWSYLNSAELGQKYGFSYQYLPENGTARIDRYKVLTAAGQPIITNVRDSYFYAGHFLVVVAYNPANDSFTVNDPSGRAVSAPYGTVTQQWSASFLESIQSGPSLIIVKAR